MSKGRLLRPGLGLLLASVLTIGATSGCKKKEFGSSIRKKTDAEVANLIDKDIGLSRWGASLYGRGYGGDDYSEAKKREIGYYNDYNGEVEYLCKNAGWYSYFLKHYREAGDSKRMKAYGDTTKSFLEKALETIKADTSTWRYDKCRRGDCKPAIGVIKDFLGQVYFNLGEDDLALRCFEESQHFNDSIGYKIGVVETIIHRGELFRERKKHKEALREFSTALEICKNMWENQKKQKQRDYDNWKGRTARCYEERSRTYRIMGDSESSLRDSRTSQELSGSADEKDGSIKIGTGF